MRTPRIAALTFLLGSCLSLCAEDAGSQHTSPALKVTVNLVLTDVLVEDRKTGQVLGPLTAEDLTLREDVVPEKIQCLSSDTLPLSIVFLLDLTDTVRPVLKPLTASARTVLAQLRPQDEAAVIVFYSTKKLLQGFTRDHDLLAKAIETASTIKSREATVPDSRHVMLFFTDGFSTVRGAAMKKMYGRSASERLHTETEAMDELLRSGAVPSALIERSALTDLDITTRYLPPLGPVMRLGGAPGDIRRYAERSGGMVMHSNREGAAIKLAELIDEMRNRYTLGYRPSTIERLGECLGIAAHPHQT